MAIGTYSELVTAVGNWMARSDLSARIPEFIAMAEAKFNRELLVRQMEQRSTTFVDTTSDSPEFVTLPADFQSMRRICLAGVIGKPTLQYLSPTELYDSRIQCFGDDAGQPQFFTVIDNEIELLPIPGDDYEIEIIYRKNIPALSSSNTTNWLLTLAPDLYLYGALREAAVFMQEDERLPVWADAYQGAVEGLRQLTISSSFNAGPPVIRVSGATP